VTFRGRVRRCIRACKKRECRAGDWFGSLMPTAMAKAAALPIEPLLWWGQRQEGTCTLPSHKALGLVSGPDLQFAKLVSFVAAMLLISRSAGGLANHSPKRRDYVYIGSLGKLANCFFERQPRSRQN
jgi:hypothetical protein